MIFYEAPHKLSATLTDMYSYFGDRKIAIVREITKIHEEVIRTTLAEASEKYKEESLKGEIPEVMVDNEINGQIRDIDYRLSMQGMNFETYLQYMGMTIEMYKENAKESALKNVKIRLALEKIVELEGIVADDEAVEAEFAKIAEGYGVDVDKVKAVIPASEVAKDVAVSKAIDFVKANAVITDAVDEKKEAKKAAAKKVQE